MDRAISVVIVLIGAILCFYFMPDVMTATRDVLTDSQTYTGNVTTAGGVTTGTVNLSRGLYKDDINNVALISSSLGTDVPVATVWTASSNTLTITGFTASQTRTMTIVYDYEATADYTAMTSTAEFAPTILMLGIIMVVLGGMFFGVKSAMNR